MKDSAEKKGSTIEKSELKSNDLMSMMFDKINNYHLLAIFIAGFTFILLSKGIPKFTTVIPYMGTGLRSFIVTILTLFFKETGVAMMIASVLGWTVEKTHKKKLNQEFMEYQNSISKDVMSAIFRKFVPEEIFTQIKESVLGHPTIKRSTKMVYELKEVVPSEFTGQNLDFTNILQCEMTTSYKLVNLSDRIVEDFEVRCGITCDLGDTLRQKVKIHKVKVGEELSSEDLKKHISPIPGNFVGESFSKKINIPPHATLEISFCSTTFKRREDTEVWTTVNQADGMSLEISYPAGIDVEAKACHPQKLECQMQNPHLMRKNFSLNYGVFPHQGILFYWKKSSTKPLQLNSLQAQDN